MHERMTAAASFLLVRACRVGHGWTRLHHMSRWVGDVWVSGRPTSDERPPQIPTKKVCFRRFQFSNPQNLKLAGEEEEAGNDLGAKPAIQEGSGCFKSFRVWGAWSWGFWNSEPGLSGVSSDKLGGGGGQCDFSEVAKRML